MTATVHGLEVPGLALRARSEGRSRRRAPFAAPVADAGRGRLIACALCLAGVTDTAARIEVAGAHEHSFVNPAGIGFRIGCFARAACLATGGPSTYWSWFPGYSWEVEVCVRCGAHLGWRFRSPSDQFHGLILDRLVEQEAEGGAY